MISSSLLLIIICSLAAEIHVNVVPAAATYEHEEMTMMNPVVEMSSREELVEIAGYGEEQLSKVIVAGKLVCHDACALLLDPHAQPYPVSGASVAVMCGNHNNIGGRRSSKKSWARGTTDEYGDFLIHLPSHLHAHPNLEQACLLKVLSLPKHSQCRHAFRGKHKGISLRTIDDAGSRTYTTDTINLTTTNRPSGTLCRKNRSKNSRKHTY
ncbi:OLC1v1021107C1 [Oldenlandia corymbosa var. corymbosa]|uniref:OLC1v1021107C1 n=1 Tax=Oldenlandia corymbosa var. corymbosa TaxID=529605 RepID=A0AAV1BUX7_OLDCO|nr:OLC1v1021107C1 [Oldenlandia corymbosa var. corymbosa]